MAKPAPKPAGRPEGPVPAHTATGRHPLDPSPPPAKEPAVQPAIDGEIEDARDATTSRAHDVTTSRRQAKVSPTKSGRRSTAPVAAEAIAFTVRFDPAEAIEIDEWMMTLRRELGRARLDKSEVFRALVTLGREHPSTARALRRTLNGS
jgi:hypothetical protein